MQFRASSTPGLMECPAMAYPEEGETLINLSDPDGKLGTATHAALEDHVNGDEKDLVAYQDRYGIPDSQKIDMKIMVAVGRIFWREYGSLFRNPETEPEFDCTVDGHTYTGHVDVFSFDGVNVHIIDWKTTRIEGKNYFWQMFRYLWLALQKYPDAQYFTYTVVFVRDQTIQSNHPDLINGASPLTATELDAYHEEFCERVLNWDGKTYCPGIECHYCPRILSCKAHTQYIAKTLDIFCTFEDKEELEDAVNGVREDVAVDLYQNIRAAESILAMGIKSIKLRCEAQGDRLEGAKGKDLILRSQIKEDINFAAAKDLLDESFTEDEIAEFLLISKTAMLDVVSDKAPLGLKKKAKDAVMSKLRQGGAVRTKPYKVPAIVPHIVEEKEIEDND